MSWLKSHEEILAEVERRVVEDEARVARQREILESERAAGLDTAAAAEVLATFERLLEASRQQCRTVQSDRWS